MLLTMKGNGVDRPSCQRLLKFGMAIDYSAVWLVVLNSTITGNMV